MERIIITEKDLTSNVNASDITDVVYVPGFASAIIGGEVGGYVAPDVNIPTLCRSVVEFEAMFGGDSAPYFEVDQEYPKQFGENAIPTTVGVGDEEQTSQIMFSAKTIDPSFIYAKELLTAGIPIIYERINKQNNDPTNTSTTVSSCDITVERMYDFLVNEAYGDSSKLINKDYTLKYITSGGYPTFEYGWSNAAGEELTEKRPLLIVKQMLQTAATRGDAIALIDHTDNPARNLIGTNSVFDIVNKYPTSQDFDTYGTMITPWATYQLVNVYAVTTNGTTDYETKKILPGSFAYFISLAKSLKTNANWLAIAGVARGLVPNIKSLHTDALLTNAIAESYVKIPSQDLSEVNICINAITNIKPYGLCIWGNRTLMDQKINRQGYATGFLNIRNLVCDIKKQAHLAAQSLMFEQNTDILWVNFKSLLTPLLNQMTTGYGISKYKILRGQTTDKTKLTATIRIYPVYAVESFEINIELTDEETVIG